MSAYDRHPNDPVADRVGSRPTDRSLPLARRTRPGPYLIALLVVIAIGIGLIALYSERLGESTGKIEQNPNAAAPSENLLGGQGNSTTDNGSSGIVIGGDTNSPAKPGPDRGVPNAP
jgi:hypothetical protein